MAPGPAPAPFRAGARGARLVADDAGLHWRRADGRTTTWAAGSDGAPATVRVVAAARSAQVPGLPPGALLVVGDAAGRPLLVVPVDAWAGRPSPPGRGDALRDTVLQPLVDALGLTQEGPGGDRALAGLAAVPVADVVPRWGTGSTVAAAVAALATAVGGGLGIAQGRSVVLAAVALAGLVGLLAASGVPLLRAARAELRVRGRELLAVRPGGRRALLLVERDGRVELGVREDDGVEQWLPVGGAGVAAVRTGDALELLDPDGRVLLSLQAGRWLPDDASSRALDALCAAAGLPRRPPGTRDRPPPLQDRDLPAADALWPRLFPREPLLLVVVFLATLNGLALLRGAELAGERPLGAAFLALAAVVLAGCLAVRVRR